MVICYFALGSVNIGLGIFFENIGIESKLLLWLGIICFLLCIFFALWGRYAEGKGKLINLGHKLVYKELKPAEFIKEYELLKNSQDLVVNKPSIEVLHLIAVAYDSLDDKENALMTVEEMTAIASKKKKAYVSLIKASFLFSYGKTEEAEILFTETQKFKLDIMCNALVNAILKCDRALALGDYKVAETYNLQMLERKFPKLDNLGKLIIHYKLGEIYEHLEKKDKAFSYFEYCANYGGETAIKTSAEEKLRCLN